MKVYASVSRLAIAVLASLSSLALSLLCSAAVQAQSNAAAPPAFVTERQVRLLVPYAPSGAVDISARILGKELSEIWAHPVVVDNRPGGAGVIAADMVSKAAGDGYTLLFTDDGVLTSMPLFQDKMPYDTLTDLTPIAMASMFPYVVIANTTLKVKSIAELLAAARAKPGAVDYATNGIGGTHHLTWERFQRAANIRLNHIPYKSSAPALQDVLAGRVPMMMAAVATVSPFIKDGRLVALATGGTERLSFLPELPTLIESGFPGLEVISWIAVLGPKSMPPALAERISRDINRVTQSKAYREALQQRGSDARTSTPQGLAERMRADYERTQALINSLGIKKN